MAAAGRGGQHGAMEHWPLFGLRIRTSRLELRPPTDDELDGFAVAAREVHDPAWMPFMVPWTDQPSPRRQRGLVQWIWRNRAQWSPADWSLALGVFIDDEPVGFQDLAGKDFAVRRSVETGSWLTAARQGSGIGTEMRAAALHLAFAGLGAVEAISGAWADNAASRRVSEHNGYEENGRHIGKRRDEAVEHVGLRLTRARWEERRRDDIEIDGLEGLLDWFGASPPDGTWWPAGD